ncbi:hypothetical protein FOL47_006042 [Perkinsus chesapeaki]|uniref:Uncharacterized protein n=1 Tax=Perkinsus chesapeaki TaxID=330153 RepID=A0A7J6LU37_PERCH|nr:hypothetical protein FOL47_006042 [Perkinsus chesapeaki]
MDIALAVAARTDCELLDDINNIKVNADDTENTRRIMEENARLDRVDNDYLITVLSVFAFALPGPAPSGESYETLQIEAVTSNRKNAAVEMKWAELARVEVPQELAKELEAQTVSCQSIIDSKDRRIREFFIELEGKNDSFVKAMKKADEDVRKMTALMTTNVRTQRDVHAKQLKAVEEHLEKERAELLGKQKKELDTLFEKRRQMEESEFIEQRQEREKQFQQKNEELRYRDLDEFGKVKMSLERSIQELQQHLERTKATYQLNKEKLDYNLQVLAERNKEHSVIESSYKTKLNKLRELKQNLTQRYGAFIGHLREENTNLTEEFSRLMQQYRHVLEKNKKFEEQDQKKFSDIWANNETEVRSLVAKVLDGDKVIHEQLLGLTWSPPTLDQIQQELEIMSEAGTVTGKSSTALVSSESGHTTGSAGGRYSGSKVKAVMDWIRQEASFLLDMGVRQQCRGLPEEHKAVVEIDAILRSIGCENQRDVDLLVSQFFRGQDEDDETWLVESDDVLKLITEFIVEKENLKIADVAPDKKKRGRKGADKLSDAEKVARRRKEEQKFWERIGHALPDMSVRLHVALETCLNRQYRLLQRRAMTVENCINLQKENTELKQLLDSYLGSKVNHELQVPPIHVIRVVNAPMTSASTRAKMPTSSSPRSHHHHRHTDVPFNAEEAKSILTKAGEHGSAGPFLQPVDWENVPGLHDYPLVVKKPMDLGTIGEKIDEDGDDAYEDFAAFEDDLNLIWDNCHLFNQPGSYIYKMATKMRTYCQSLCSAAVNGGGQHKRKRKTSHLSEGKHSRSRRSSTAESSNRSEVKVEKPTAPVEVVTLPPMDKAAAAELHAAKIRLGWRLHSSMTPKELALVVEFMRYRKTGALKPLGAPDDETGSESFLLDIDHLAALDYECFTDVSQFVDLIIRYKEGS